MKRRREEEREERRESQRLLLSQKGVDPQKCDIIVQYDFGSTSVRQKRCRGGVGSTAKRCRQYASSTTCLGVSQVSQLAWWMIFLLCLLRDGRPHTSPHQS